MNTVIVFLCSEFSCMKCFLHELTTKRIRMYNNKLHAVDNKQSLVLRCNRPGRMLKIKATAVIMFCSLCSPSLAVFYTWLAYSMRLLEAIFCYGLCISRWISVQIRLLGPFHCFGRSFMLTDRECNDKKQTYFYWRREALIITYNLLRITHDAIVVTVCRGEQKIDWF